MNFAKYYADIREQHAALAAQFPDGICHVVALTARPSAACQVTIEIAAKLLVEGTHKLADDSQVAEFQRDQAMRRAVTTGIGIEAARALFGITSGKGK